MARYIAPNGVVVEADAGKGDNLLRAGFRRADEKKPAAKKAPAKKSAAKKK